MTRGTKKALWALGLLGLATGAGVAVYYSTKPKGSSTNTNANLPPVPPITGGGGGGGGGSPTPGINPFDPYGSGKSIGQWLLGK